MDIIKNGSCHKIRFTCFECECIFDANLGEAKVTRQGEGSFSFVEYTCCCPHCGYSCRKVVNTQCPEQRMQAIGKYGNPIENV